MITSFKSKSLKKLHKFQLVFCWQVIHRHTKWISNSGHSHVVSHRPIRSNQTAIPYFKLYYWSWRLIAGRICPMGRSLCTTVLVYSFPSACPANYIYPFANYLWFLSSSYICAYKRQLSCTQLPTPQYLKM